MFSTISLVLVSSVEDVLGDFFKYCIAIDCVLYFKMSLIEYIAIYFNILKVKSVTNINADDTQYNN
jgi:hypothetical protein